MYVDIFVKYNYSMLLYAQKRKKYIRFFSFLVFCLYHWLMFGLMR